MSIAWTDDLSVGNTAIDQQHQELFSKVNQMLEAGMQNKGKEVLGEIIEFLASYVVYHFGYEEKFMEQYKYPNYLSHKKMHDEFVQKFLDVKNQFEKNGAASYIVIMTNRMVVGWLNDHIRNVDKLLGEYLKDKKSS